MKKLLLLTLMALAMQTQAQNVGIGNSTPAEKLDVTGNINVTGTIKANGVDGAAGQILMKNKAGQLIWGDACEYKNYKVYQFTTLNATQNFTIPAGVTKIKVQLWGGGGRGITQYSITGDQSGAGGGGGGYLEATLNVVQGAMFSLIIAEGATEANMLTISGANTIFNLTPTGGNALVAYGGTNAYGTASSLTRGIGGGFSFPNTLNTIWGKNGEDGHSNKFTQTYLGIPNLSQEILFGNGGNAGNTTDTGGIGGFFYQGNGVRSEVDGGGKGKVPGGGGSASTRPSTTTERDGGNGLMIIYW